ncbi:reverse transcriptase domain-containing protein [Bacillus haynesii]|uniref:reverse transcriptase domain-containing protein n=2 Tax=Bacillus haynesii TaxID=1925021 RepID=UPI00227F745C|nr:reverse transcriptase domain-containing protein [Bacillus haynesii]MCY8004446.1 reverse transcriptase domain-containing protein [Bacillus haynesii]MCY8077614.1 reverse transcriptase domain-containing protein [Bacillus haynesii]MEC0752622.1 reverse transcriptase domain-containing protein [Bacillus haynesii]
MDLINLTYEYILSMSKSKKYNPQTIAIVNFFDKYGLSFIKTELERDVKEFCRINTHFKARDFIYKNDYFTPRNMYLISPLYYTYYTYIVFRIAKLFLNTDTKLDFSKNRMKIFYSGFLDTGSNAWEIGQNSKFNKSYNSFQKEREEYFDYPVLKIDLQDFFNSIKLKPLIIKLRRLLGENKIIDDLEYFLDFCGFDCLPQFHYSIASSILSQMYLREFDSKIENLVERENLILIRFVDDMYFIYLDGLMDYKRNNNLLNEISHLLWKEELVLNSSKTKFLSPDEYRYTVEVTNDYDEERVSFASEKIIDERTKEIINKGYLIQLVNELCTLEKSSGIDLKKYREIMNKYISIEGEDNRKILNNIIFSGKWKQLSDKDLMKITENWRYIQFNPSQFTVLYILVCRHLENKNAISGSKIKQILNYLFRNTNFTFRDTLVAVAYLFQNKSKNNELLQKIEKINIDYVEFVREFI